MELVSLFYLVDEFCKEFEPKYRAHLLETSEASRIKPELVDQNHTTQ